MPYKPTGRPPGRPRKKLVNGERPELNDNQWRGLEAELRGFDPTRFPLWPSRSSLRNVAAYVGVCHKSVAKWRKSASYFEGLWWLLNEHLPEPPKHSGRPPIRYYPSERHEDIFLDADVHKHWTGPTVSPVDGKTYDDPGSYIRHIKDARLSGIRWIGDLPAPWSKGKTGQSVRF